MTLGTPGMGSFSTSASSFKESIFGRGRARYVTETGLDSSGDSSSGTLMPSPTTGGTKNSPRSVIVVRLDLPSFPLSLLTSLLPRLLPVLRRGAEELVESEVLSRRRVSRSRFLGDIMGVNSDGGSDDLLLPSPSLFDLLGCRGFGDDSYMEASWLPAGLGPTLPLLLLFLGVAAPDCADDEARETWLPWCLVDFLRAGGGGAGTRAPGDADSAELGRATGRPVGRRRSGL